jgi:hypothetical protein
MLTPSSSAAITPFQPKPSGERFVRLRHALLESPTWQNLPATAQAAYVDIARRFNGQNNGNIAYSVRDCARAVHVGKSTAARILKLLEWSDLIRRTRHGSFSLKTAESTLWELPECKQTVPPQVPYGPTTGTVNGLNGPTTGTLIDKSLELRTGRWDFRGRKDQKEKKEAETRLRQYRELAKNNGGGQ